MKIWKNQPSYARQGQVESRFALSESSRRRSTLLSLTLKKLKQAELIDVGIKPEKIIAFGLRPYLDDWLPCPKRYRKWSY